MLWCGNNQGSFTRSTISPMTNGLISRVELIGKSARIQTTREGKAWQYEADQDHTHRYNEKEDQRAAGKELQVRFCRTRHDFRKAAGGYNVAEAYQGPERNKKGPIYGGAESGLVEH